MTDENTLFRDKPFSYILKKDKTAEIRFKGKPLKIISGKEYNKLERVIAMDNAPELQLFLLKIGGIK